MGFSLQFAQMAAFLAAFAAPIIFLAYLRQKNQQRTVVSSIYILEQLRKNAVIRKRFKPPLNSLFELLALLFLVCALAQPLLVSDQNRVAILLDTSLSMSAKIDDTNSRLAEAKKSIQAWLDSADASATYSLYTSAPSLKQVGTPNVGREQIRRSLTAITASPTSDSLPASLLELSESGKFEKILVVSDRNLRFDEDVESPSSTSASQKTEIEPLLISAERSNYYFQNARLLRRATSPGGRVILATLGFSGTNAAEITVNVLASSRTLPQSDGDYSLALKQQFTLSPHRAQPIEIELPSSTRSARSFRLELTASATLENAITIDDIAWLTSAKSTEHSILLVAPESIGTRDLGLHRLSNFQFTVVSASEYAQMRDSDFKRYGLILFYQTAPVVTPTLPSFFILPPAENSLFPVRETVDTPTLSSWDTAHPMLTYLRVPVLAPSRVQLYDVPSWARSVLNTEKGSAAVVAESRGIRFAALGFEIFPYEGKRAPATSILLINSLRWLLGSDKLGAGFRTGAALPLKGDKTWVIAAPDGEIETLETTQAKPLSFIFTKPGLYNVTGISTSSEEVNKESQTYAVQSFFPAESATAKTTLFETPQYIAHQNLNAETTQALWWVPLILAILMLLIDFLLRARSASSSMQRTPSMEAAA